MKLITRRVALAAVFALPLGGCLEAVVHPLNPEPTAFEDSQCVRGPQDSGEVVNYGCVAGRALVASRHHRHHRVVVHARY